LYGSDTEKLNTLE
jgi:hypothetical protein